ncbi:MAG: NAD(P)/FAD-dependent oxidoreductase [Solirubrobacteraceae bacterium]
MTVRATAHGARRGSLDGITADVLICGASFAGLAVARELAGCGASVLLVDRYELGERATSACATPTPWLEALGLSDAIRQELAHMRFSTPHGSVRYRLPWSWSAFDYRRLCQLLYAQSDARFETAKVQACMTPDEPLAGDLIAVLSDRGVLRAPLVVDALGWRRVLSDSGFQPPEAPLSRGLEVHPNGGGEDLDVWVQRSLVRRGYGWRVPAGGEARVGVASYAPADHVRLATVELAERLGLEAVRYQGNWFPHRLRPATESSVFFVGDSAGHCFPLSGEGIRTAFYFGIACGRELTAVLEQRRSRTEALQRYHAFSAGHARAFALAAGLQRLIPALPPRLLTGGLRLFGQQWLIDRGFGWYLDQAHPSFADPVAVARTPKAPSSHNIAERHRS